MKKITIYYEKGFYGRLRAVKIFADSLQVDLLKPGEEKTFECAENVNEIYAKMDWGKTDTLKVSTLFDGEKIILKSYFTLNPLRNIGIMSLPFIWKK